VITDHPIPQPIIDANLSAAKAFFALPADVKQSYYSQALGGQRGYTPFGTENAKGRKAADLKEFWHTGRNISDNSPYANIMKPTPPVHHVEGFDAATRAVYQAFDAFGRDILQAIALDLTLDKDYFERRVESGNSILRLLHYPAQTMPAPQGTVRAAAHEDINVITLLLGAEEAGLQVQHSSGKWLSVNPPAGALVVNCGDMLQRLTAGVLPSTTHRVLNPTAERAHLPRYSTPFFLHFNPDVLIEALPSCLDDTHHAQPPITARDYLMERLIEIGLVKKPA
jgi:isopenicillin N synthase-like dioxygenase